MPNPPKLTSQGQIDVLKSLTQGAAAWLIGLSARTFRDSAAPRNPDGSYNAQAVAAWIKQGVAPDGDPLMAGGDSPSLERYRAAKADLAEMDAKVRRGQLVDVDQLIEWWTVEVASPLRRATAALQARFGDAAEEIVAAALAKAETAIERRQVE